jgi:ribosomal protein S27E
MDNKNNRKGVRGPAEPVEVGCLKCGRTAIIYLPKEPVPRCEECGVEMVIRELLDEGKSY